MGANVRQKTTQAQSLRTCATYHPKTNAGGRIKDLRDQWMVGRRTQEMGRPTSEALGQSTRLGDNKEQIRQTERVR